MMYTVQITCPIHALQPMLAGAGIGARPFASISAAAALGVLRAILTKLDVANASEYRCHDLRRGHARDLQMSGKPFASVRMCGGGPCCVQDAPLYEILVAGEWRSPAFLDDLDLHSLERDMVIQAHCDESDDYA